MGNKMDQIIEAIQDPKIKVVSFDVFDTLVLRPFWAPSDLFMFLDKEASELFHTPDIIRFSEFRKSYELEARDKIKESGKEDLTITDIYNYIADNSPYPTDVLNALMEKEKELEFRFCYARKSTQQLIEAAVSSGKHVIAVSDMYLPTEFIRAILEHCGINSIERIFVSGDVGLTKRSGHLYEHVAREMGVRCQEIVHIGDNVKTDVRIPRKMSIRAFFYPRTIALMSKGQTGSAYRHAYEQIRSSFSNYHATEELGIRCMLAVAANRVYDNPFHDDRTGGDYAGDTSLFGNLALGMYAFAHGLWVYRLAQEKHYDHVLFFARDGYLPYLAYEMLRKSGKTSIPEASYVRTSRKAVLPMLFTTDAGPFKVGSHFRYLDHSPKSVTRIMSSVLSDNTSVLLEERMGEAWNRPFKSETDLVNFMSRLHSNHVDPEKAKRVKKGFLEHFIPLMDGSVLTYDIGYSLRSEIVLRELFPNVNIDACITHGIDDRPLTRGAQGNVNVHMFYT
ncbi:MAG: HAD-IA family hydrolase, partial [Oscillospiraceae bacterium]|nr:HAD-IA family hydrolase [Oscillospiraceae bacterium]